MTDCVRRAVLSNLRYDLQGAKRLQIRCQQRSLKSMGHLTRITLSPLFSEFSVHCKWAGNLELVSFLRAPSFRVLFRPQDNPYRIYNLESRSTAPSLSRPAFPRQDLARLSSRFAVLPISCFSSNWDRSNGIMHMRCSHISITQRRCHPECSSDNPSIQSSAIFRSATS